VNYSAVNAYVDRGVAKASIGDGIGAIEDWRKAIKIDPKCAQARQNLSVYGQ
jgi:hypothetical protein